MLFSILTACGSGPQYTEDWFDSILAQTHRPLEVIFIDDASPDGCFSVVKKKRRIATKNDISLRMFKSKKRRYYGGALREAATQATGEYMGILDFDDMLMPHSVEHVVKLYQEHPNAKYIWTQFVVCDCDMAPKKMGFSKMPDKKEGILTMGLKNHEHIYSHFRTVARSAPSYVSIFPERGKYAVDQLMAFNLEERTTGMFSNRACYLYRSGCKNTISSSYGSQRRQYWLKMLQQHSIMRAINNTPTFPIVADPTDWTQENLKWLENANLHKEQQQ